MKIISEKKKGLQSFIKFKCEMCNLEQIVSTTTTAEHASLEKVQSKEKNVNTDAVAGIISIGCGLTNMNELFSTLEIPGMSERLFSKEMNFVAKSWEIAALDEMELAATEEKKLAFERGEIDRNQIPLLTVVVDGSWAKRSYRSNYASSSGVVST